MKHVAPSRQSLSSRTAAWAFFLAMTPSAATRLAAEPSGAPQSATAIATAPSAPAPHPKVLVLHSSHRGFPVSDGVGDGVIDAARRRGSGASDIYVEYLDLVRYNTPEDQRRTADLLRWKMKNVPIQAIVAGGRETMDFLAGEARDIAPGAPVIMAATSGRSNALVGRQVLLVPLRVDFTAMLSTVSAALPTFDRILVVTGANVSDRPTRLDFIDAAAEWQERFKFEYTDGLTYAEMMNRVSRLESGAAIVFIGYFGDAAGKPFVSAEVINSIAKTANAPVFVSLEGHFRPGLLGGPLLPFNAYGKEIGRLAMDLAAGLPAIPESLDAARRLLVPTFNWSEVQKWHIDPDALPAGSVFIGRPPSLWQQYRKEMIATGTAFVMMTALVISLWLQSRRRKLAEEAAKASEERVRVLVEAAPEAIFSFDVDTGHIVDANPRSISLFGVSKGALTRGGPERFFVAGEINGAAVPASIGDYANEALEGGEPVFERLIARANEGGTIPCEVRLARLPDPRRRLVRATLTDIAERKAIDSALYLLAGRSGSDTQRRDFIVDTLRELCAVIEVDVALIASLDAPDTAQTWVRWADGSASFGGAFGLRGTLCEQVANERSIHLLTAGAHLETPPAALPDNAQAECAAAASLWNSQNKCIGFLVVSGRRPMRHPIRARAVLQIVAGRAAQELEGMRRDRDLILHQAELEAEVATRTSDLALANENLQLLGEFGRQVAASLDSQVIISSLRTGLPRLMPADGLRILMVEGSGADELDAADEHERALQQCIDEPGVVALSRTDQDSAWPNAPDGSCSALAAPLLSQQGPIGLLVVYSRAQSGFAATHLAIIETLALHVASAMSNSRAYAQLRLAQEQLVEREKMAALGSLVAGVAHELSTPLGNALLLTTTLNERVRELQSASSSREQAEETSRELQQVVQQAGEMIERSLNRAATLMSSFKQVAVDQTVDRRRTFDLAEVVGELAATLSNQLEPQRHQLSLQIPRGIEMDSFPGSLVQVLTNLIVNALQHGLDGRMDGRISISATARRDDVTIEFSDNGRGISDLHLRRIFDPFFTTRLGRGGTGLGLSISYNIVTSVLGGSIRVSSPAGSGAVFKLVIPTKAPPQAAAPYSPMISRELSS